MTGQLSRLVDGKERRRRRGVKRKKNSVSHAFVFRIKNRFFVHLHRAGTDICISVVQGSVTNRHEDGRDSFVSDDLSRENRGAIYRSVFTRYLTPFDIWCFTFFWYIYVLTQNVKTHWYYRKLLIAVIFFLWRTISIYLCIKKYVKKMFIQRSGSGFALSFDVINAHNKHR